MDCVFRTGMSAIFKAMGYASLLCSVCFILGYLQFSSKKILADKNEVQGSYIKRSCEAGVEGHRCRRSLCSVTAHWLYKTELMVYRAYDKCHPKRLLWHGDTEIMLHEQCCFLCSVTAHWLCQTELMVYRAYGKRHPKRFCRRCETILTACHNSAFPVSLCTKNS